jgi:ABC-type glycerol-3-phosphate transport system substrate-binding protein
MEMSKKALVCLVILLGLLLAVTPISAQGERVLEVWSHDYQPLAQALTDKWIPEFEKANPGVKINYTSITFAGSGIDYDTKLLADLASGAGPDAWVMGSWNYNENKYIESGLVAPLDPSIFGYSSVDDVVADYPPNGMNAFVRDGKLYAMFNELTTMALFYNKDMFDAAGIEYLPEDKPVSWDTIGEIGQKLRKTDASGALSQIGFQFGFFASFRSPQWYAQDYYLLMRQYGQNDLFVDGKPAANTEAAVKAFQMIYDFTWKYQAYDPTFLANWFADFPNNRVAMVWAGPWFVAAARGTNPDMHFGVAPTPVVNPDDKATYDNIVYSWGWSVNPHKSADQQKLAQEFLASFLGKKGEADQPVWWFENMGLGQPRKAFLASDGYKAALQKEPWLNQFSKSFDMFKTDYLQHSYDQAGAALIRAIDRVIYDQMSAQDTADLLQRELQRLG